MERTEHYNENRHNIENYGHIQRLRQREVFKDKNEVDYIRYFETIKD
jgi:hypothetical protein